MTSAGLVFVVPLRICSILAAMLETTIGVSRMEFPA